MDPNDHYIQIYERHGQTYHEMITFEDVEGNLRPALEAVTSFRGKAILDLGSGTGRIPLLFPETPIVCLDLHMDMLRENQRQQAPDPGILVRGDMRYLPFHESTFEVVTAGWALGHFPGWYHETWKAEAAQVLEEAQRVLSPGGALIIIETMSTGALSPAPPTPRLAAYYGWLENVWEFSRQVIQTDYQFDDLGQAVQYARFFFGDELAKEVRTRDWVRLPEWTGIWSKKKFEGENQK
ncbi:MAG: class I SAM-dependent methyltransferase [Anaerolineales bacterium]